MKHDEAVARLVKAGFRIYYQNPQGTILTARKNLRSITIWDERTKSGSQFALESNEKCVSNALLEIALEVCP